MFTGIVTDVGEVVGAEQRGDLRLRIRTGYDLSTVGLGASVACSGVCLTVVDKGDDWFAVDVSAETVSRTAKDMWREGARLNLERPLRMGDELGGHIVTGHVDSVGEVIGVFPEGDSSRIGIRVDRSLAQAIAQKGWLAFLGERDPAHRTGDDIGRSRAGPTTQCRGRRDRALHRSNAGYPRTIGTSLFLLFITLQCDYVPAP